LGLRSSIKFIKKISYRLLKLLLWISVGVAPRPLLLVAVATTVGDGCGRCVMVMLVDAGGGLKLFNFF
jgi:hypothetical protein